MPRRTSTPWALLGCSGLGIGFLLLLGLVFIASLSGGAESVSGPRIALIELSGVISDQGASGLIGGSSSGARDIIDSLDKARLDDSVKAVVIRINSPGGAAAASQEMFNAVQRLKKSGKPVVCSMGDVAASGGYYVAAACDQIFANGATTTGSIGVISEFLNYGEVMKKVGLSETTIKSGKFKDAGSPSRPITPAEKQLFQSMVMNIYNQFVDDVAAGRKGKLSRAQIVQLADGRVYSGTQAKKNKLIDQIGGLYEASVEAAKLAKIPGEPKLYPMKSGRGLLGSLMSSETSSEATGFANQIAGSAGAAAGKSFAQSVTQQLRTESATAAAPQLR